MKTANVGGTALGIVVCVASFGRAQFTPPAAPAVPTVPVAPAVVAPAVPGAIPAAPARNLWSFFLPTPEQKAACAAHKEKFCRSTFGQLISNLAKPLASVTGGLVPPCCPPPTAPGAAGLDPNASPTGAEAAADKIKKLEAEAKARRAAVRYLGTVDCRRFTNAEPALIAALRTDTNECVRWEAALGLGHGCCCTKKVIEALTLTVNGETKDGNPVEASERVRAAAAAALDHCLACYVEPPATTAPRPEGPPEKPVAAADPATLQLTAYYARVEARPADVLLAAGRKALDDHARAQAGRSPLVTGNRSLYEAFVSTREPAAGRVEATQTAPQTAPPPSALPPLPSAAALPPLTPVAAEDVRPAAAVAPPTGKRSLFEIFKGTAPSP